MPSCPEPRSRARSETAAGSAPSRHPSDSVRSRSSSVPIPCSTSARGPSRSTRSSASSSSSELGVPSRAGRDRARELVHERLAPRPQLFLLERQHEQAHAAVDVVADAARRDHAVGWLGRRDAADREAVALVDVRHRQRRADDPGQRGHVLELLERAVPQDRLDQLLVGEHTRGHTHVVPAPDRDLPADRVHPLQGRRAHRQRSQISATFASVRVRRSAVFISSDSRWVPASTITDSRSAVRRSTSTASSGPPIGGTAPSSNIG